MFKSLKIRHTRPAAPANKKSKKPLRVLYLLCIIPLVYIILALGLMPSQVSFTVGEVAAEDVYYSGSTLTYASDLRTEEALNEAAADVGQIYLIDDSVTINLLDQIDAYSAQLGKAALIQDSPDFSLEDVREDLPGFYNDDALRSMLDLSRNEQITLFTSFKAMVRKVYDQGVGNDQIDAAREQVALAINSSSITGNNESFFKSLLEGMDLPYNKVYDAVATRAAQDEAMALVTPVQVTIQSGQKLVSRGALITDDQLEALQAAGLYRERAQYSPYIGLLLLILALSLLVFIYLRQYHYKIFEKRSSMLLFGVVLVFVLIMCKLISLIQFSADPGTSALIGYLLPVPVASLLLTVLLDEDAALLATAVLALFIGVIMDGELAYAAVALAGGLAGIITAARLNQRSQFVGASMWIILVNLSVISGWGLLTGGSWAQIALGSLFGLINGLLCAILAMGVLPYFEGLFGITTVIRLLELSNSNHPLLKRLMMEAPGTYNHSILVGNLAEAAADAIGADSLLVRVASYYHDIGKLKRPHFYIENQHPGENPHDKLQPALSAMIITSHTVDGAKVLKEYRFPAEIINIVEQHHGDSVLPFFYHKAKEQALDPAEIKEDDFRYQGSRPKTKEAALVMLADSVQAGVQALTNADADRVEERVREVVQHKTASGQLQDCPLTFRDLELVIQSFLMVLSGMNHQRISYPGQSTDETALPGGNNV